MWGRRYLSLVAWCGLYGTAACGNVLDTQRQPAAAQSLGATLYEEFCQRVAHSADPRDVTGQSTFATCRYGVAPATSAGPSLLALTTQRDRFILAVDTAVDPDLVPDLRSLMGRMVPLYDDGTLQAHMAAVSDAIRGLAQAPDAVHALGRLAARRGYVPAEADFAQACLSYDRLHVLSRTLSRGPGADPGVWRLLQRSIAEQLDAAPEAFLSDGAEGLATVSQFLLSPLADPAAAVSAQPHWVVRRDRRGMAVPASDAGRPVAPFVDRDGDGMADVDRHGHFLGADGRRLTNLPTPFPLAARRDQATRTPHARALRQDGGLWYEYRATAPTVLAGLYEQLRDLMVQAPEAALSWLAVVQAAAGTPSLRTHTFSDGSTQQFVGFAAETSAWVDVAEGLAAAADGPELGAFLTLASAMWAQHEPAIAGLIALMWRVDAWQTAQPALYAPKLSAGANLAPDLLALAAEYAAVPGLVEDVLAALAHPATADLGPYLAAQMAHTDDIDFDAEAVNGPAQGALVTPVRRDRADVGNNQSLFERLLALVHDARGLKICSNAVAEPFPVYAACELFTVEDAATFYVQAMAGTATLTMRLGADDFFFPEQFSEAAAQDPGHSELEAFTGIEGFRKIANPAGAPPSWLTFSVTPEAASRLLFSMYDERVADDSAYGQTRAAAQMVTPRLFVGGVPFDVLHRGTLFAWEAPGFKAAMQPLLAAFAAHGREDLLVALVDTLHSHWPTPQNAATQSRDVTRPDYAAQSGLARFEPLLARLFDDGDVLAGIGALLEHTRHQVDAAGHDGIQTTAALMRHMVLADHHPDLVTAREGVAPQSATAPLTAASLLWRGVADMATSLQAALPADSSAKLLLRQACVQWLDVQADAAGYHFKNRQAHALTQATLRFAQTRLAVAPAGGAAARRPTDIARRTRDLLDNTAVQAVVQLGGNLAATADASDEVAQFITHLVGTRLEATLKATADMLQVLGDVDNLAPLLRQAHVWLQPDTGLVSQSMHLMATLQDIDATQAMPRLLQGAVRNMGAETPMAALTDIFARVNRTSPGNDGPLAAGDIAALLATGDDLIHSQEHGFARLLELIQGRQGAPDRP